MPDNEMPEKLRVIGFSYRQIEVTQAVCQGMINRDIAAKLFVSEKCIKYHLTNIFRLSSVKNRTELAAWASSL